VTQIDGELAHDQAWTEEKERVLWTRLQGQLWTRHVACEACRELAREYVAGTDIYGTPSWARATRLGDARVEMDGIIYGFGPRFLAVFKKSAFGYAADEAGACPGCHRRWHYRANYHLGSFDGCLTLFTDGVTVGPSSDRLPP
jgi:hypothetical protein